MGVRLPAEYQETEYIQSTGTQYFTTDIPKYKDIVFDCVQEITANRDQYLIGWAYQNQWNQVQACGWYNNKGQCAYGGSYTAGSIALNTKVHTRYEFAPGTQKVYIDGNLVSTQTKTNGSADNGLPFLMFCGRLPNTNPTPYYYSAQKVYSLKVYHADQIIADYVPCYRKSDGEIGMFDLVLQKFYINEGTGVFLKGADVIDSISPWLVARRRSLMMPRKYGPNLLALSDFTQRTEGGTCVIDDQTGIITVSGSNRYAGVSTPTGFAGSHLIVGHTYEMHCRLVSATNASLARFSIRGKRGNENQVAYSAIPTAVGAEASVVFTVDEYMSYFTLFATWTDAGSQTIAYSDVWVKEILS